MFFYFFLKVKILNHKDTDLADKAVGDIATGCLWCPNYSHNLAAFKTKVARDRIVDSNPGQLVLFQLAVF